MLRVHQITSPQAAAKYYSRGGDYYGQELVGDWGGKAAAMLGLEGKVDSKAFDLLCNNQHPSDGSRVTAHTKGERTVGYDFNFNAPKGVSLLYGTTRSPEMLEAFRSAVAETMLDVEADMKTRVRKGKKNEDRVVGNLVSAEFVHFTSRPVDGIPDPSLHAHVVTFNMVHDPVEQKWKAGFFRDAKRDSPYYEALFHNRLAGKLSALGLAVERRGARDWDLAAVPQSLVRKFSRRTEQIEKLAQELGIVDPKAKDQLGATSREHKTHKLGMDELRQTWLRRLTQPEFRALEQAFAARQMKPLEPGADDKAVRHAVSHLFARRSVVPYREILALALRQGPGQVTLGGVEHAANQLGMILQSSEGRLMATMPEVLREERRIVAFGKNTRGTRSRLGSRGRAVNREWLSAEQKQAVNQVLSSTDQAMLIEGKAGVGKTTLTEELVDGIMENGRSVVMVAPSAEASRGVLREAGFKDADTLQRLLVDTEMQDVAKGNVILVDEAGLVGAPTMAKLIDLVERLDSRLILIGDRNQHHAVERGSPFELLAEKAGLKVARVEGIRRQKEKYLEAVKMLADRRAAEGLDRLDAMGWVREVKHPEIYAQAARAFIEFLGQCDGDVRAVAPTHAEIAHLTAAIRTQLAAAGRLGQARVLDIWRPAQFTEAELADVQNYEPGMLVKFHKAAPGHKAGERLVVNDPASVPTELAERFTAYRPGQLQLAIGDRVRLTANGNSIEGHRLNNGTVYGVAGFTAKGDIRLDNGWTVAKDWGHLAHGWATTSHSAQSRTFRRAVVVQSSLSLPATTAQQLYVSASHHKEQTLFFTDSKEALREAVQRDDRRMSAIDLVTQGQRDRQRQILRRIGFVRRLTALERQPLSAKQPERELVHERA